MPTFMNLSSALSVGDPFKSLYELEGLHRYFSIVKRVSQAATVGFAPTEAQLRGK